MRPNIAIVCSIVIEHGGKLLLIKEAASKVRGKWNTPAGRLEGLETPIKCALREAKEESGYDAELTGVQAVYHRPAEDEYLVEYCFLAKPKSLETSPLASDVLEARWFTKDELRVLPKESLRSERSANRVKDWLAGKRFPLEVVAEHPQPKHS